MDFVLLDVLLIMYVGAQLCSDLLNKLPIKRLETADCLRGFHWERIVKLGRTELDNKLNDGDYNSGNHMIP